MPEIAKHRIFHRTVVKAAVLIVAAGIIAGVRPLSAEAQTPASPPPTMPQTAPAYPYQQPIAAQSAYPYWYNPYYPYWAYAYPWGRGYPWGWGWPVGVSVAFGGCFNCGFRGAFFGPGFGRFGFAHPAFFHPGFGRLGFAHAGFGGGFRGGGRR